MAKQPESVRIEVKTKRQAQLLNYALGVVHRELANQLLETPKEQMEEFKDNVVWTLDKAEALNEKFALSALSWTE
jgi:hypothetical protein